MAIVITFLTLFPQCLSCYVTFLKIILLILVVACGLSFSGLSLISCNLNTINFLI